MSPLPALPTLPVLPGQPLAGMGLSAATAEGAAPVGAFAEQLARSSAQLASQTAITVANTPTATADMPVIDATLPVQAGSAEAVPGTVDPNLGATRVDAPAARAEFLPAPSSTAHGAEAPVGEPSSLFAQNAVAATPDMAGAPVAPAAEPSMSSEPGEPMPLTDAASMASWIAMWAPPAAAQPTAPKLVTPRGSDLPGTAATASPLRGLPPAASPGAQAHTVVRDAVARRMDLRAEDGVAGEIGIDDKAPLASGTDGGAMGVPLGDRIPSTADPLAPPTNPAATAQALPQAAAPIAPAAHAAMPFDAAALRGELGTVAEARGKVSGVANSGHAEASRPSNSSATRLRGDDLANGPAARPEPMAAPAAFPLHGALAQAAAAPPGADDARSGTAPTFSQLLDIAALAQGQLTSAVGNSANGNVGALGPVVTLGTPVQAPEFREALGAQVSVFARDGVQHAELHLNPAEMGPISVRIALDGQQAQVNFGVDNATTRALVEAGMPELASALREAGLTLSGGGVSEHARGQAGDAGGAPRDGGRPPGQHGQGRGGGQADELAEPAPPRPRTVRLAGGIDVYA